MTIAESTALTPRQKEVLRLLADGKRPAEIADALCLEICTVYTHLEDIRQRLQARTNENAVYLAYCLIVTESTDSCVVNLK